jgi:hypothetical protein
MLWVCSLRYLLGASDVDDEGSIINGYAQAATKYPIALMILNVHIPLTHLTAALKQACLFLLYYHTPLRITFLQGHLA